MPTNLPMWWRRGGTSGWPSRVRYVKYVLLVVLILCALFLSFRSQFGEMFASIAPKQRVVKTPDAKLPDVIKLGAGNQAANQPATAPNGSKLPTVVKLGANPTTPAPPNVPANARLVDTGPIQIVDGDTISMGGKAYRLVGIDTPESGTRAKCQSERDLAERAANRLRQIVMSANVKIDRVACSHCPPGTEGTDACNFGRLCGVLTVGGRDAGLVLIGEGLAKRYNCGPSGCPPKQAWCS